MKEYLDCLEYIIKNGEDVDNRTGVKTRSVFGYQMQFDLSKGFPAVTTKKLAWKPVVAELLWFLEGSTDERRLAELTYNKDKTEITDKKTIWTANADHQGKQLGYINNEFRKELGPVYGAQWRNFGGIKRGDWGTDQISWVIDEIKNNPDSRRLIVSAWSANQIQEMALPPCHTMFQFKVLNGKLHCQLYQRSADVFLGVPFNIASYSLLTHIVAKECDLDVGHFVHTMGDAHIYHNHFDAVDTQLQRTPKDLPKLIIDPKFKLQEVLEGDTDLDVVNYFSLDGYNPDPIIKAPMAV